MGYSHLGHIVENCSTSFTTHCGKSAASGGYHLNGASGVHSRLHGERAALLTQDGAMLTARLVITADGANSRLRNKRRYSHFWDHQVTMRFSKRLHPRHRRAARRGCSRRVFHGEGILRFCRCRSAASVCSTLSGRFLRRMRSVCNRAATRRLTSALTIASIIGWAYAAPESERQVFLR